VRRAAVRGTSALVTLLVLALATACTGGSVTPGPSASKSGAHLLWWDISTLTGALAADKSLAAQFVQANPGTSVDVVVMTPDEAHGKFDTAVQTAAAAPDVITVLASWIPDWSARGYITRLDDTVAADGAEDVLPSLLPMEKYDGRIMAALRSPDGMALLYNPKILQRAGLTVPRSWTDIAADNSKFTALDVQTLYAPATGEGLLPWIYGEGGSLVDPEAKTINISEPPAVAGLSRRLQMQATGVTVDDTALWESSSTPPNEVTTTAMRAAFRQGRVAMILDDAASLPLLVGGPAFPSRSAVGIATIPAGTIQASGPVTATGYAVFSGSHNLSAAYAFVKFAQSPTSQAALAEQLGLLPTRASAYTAEVVKADPVLGAFLPVLRAGTPLPQVQIQPSMLLTLDDNFRAALLGDASPQSALDTVAAAWQKDLNGGYTIGPATG
jgi:arabinogalactan oligomer/maltooligosaccharide transport system substrate-binding protein